MSTHTIGGHNSHHRAAHARRFRFGWPWRKDAVTPDVPAVQRGENPYPETGETSITDALAALGEVPAIPPFTGASEQGLALATPPWQPMDGDPDQVAELPASVRPFHAAETMADVLKPEGRPFLPENPDPAADVWMKPDPAVLRDALDGTDPGEPLAFVRRSAVRLCERPEFLGLAPAGERQVAEVTFGFFDVYAMDRAAIDATIRMLMLARDNLVYSERVTPERGDDSENTADDGRGDVADAPVEAPEGGAAA